MAASQGPSISVLEIVQFFALAIGLGLISRFLNARPSRSRKSRRSTRKPRPLWRDVLGWAIGLTVFWAILVAPTVLDSSGTLLNTSGFGIMLSFGVLVICMATVGLWARHRTRERTRFERIETVNDLLLLPQDEFEHFIAHLFQAKGSTASVVGGGGDHGVDILVETQGGKRAIVQCKRWSGKWVDESVIRDLYGAMMHDGANTRGYLVTTSTFSEAAREWAEGKPITLIDGSRLADAMAQLRKTT